MKYKFVIGALIALSAIHFGSYANCEDFKYYRSLAEYYDDNGQFDKAISAYTMAIERNPTRGDVYYDRGNVHYKKGDYKKAIEDFTKAIEIEPMIAPVVLLVRGYTYLVRLKDKKGCSDLMKACDLGACGGYFKAKKERLCE